MIPACGLSLSVERPLQPVHVAAIDCNHVETARWQRRLPHQVVARRKDDAPLFGDADAGRSATVAGTMALAYFDKHAGAVACAHDQVDLTAAASRRSIIALQQHQPGALQVLQRQRLGGVTALFGCGWRRP